MKRFLAVASDATGLAAFLECVYTAHLMRERHPGLYTILLVHPSSAKLAEESGVFDEVLPVGADLAKSIRTVGADIVYVPAPDLRTQLKLLFSGSIRLAGGSRLGRFLRFFDVHSSKDAAALKRGGLDVLPGVVGIKFKTTTIQGEQAVYLSLFGEHNVSGSWPIGHAARLSRLLSQIAIKTIVPLPIKKFQRAFRLNLGNDDNSREFAGEIQYLRKNAPEIQFVDAQGFGSLADLMRKSALVVAPAGPESVLAGLLEKRVITLHDMQSNRYQGRPELRRNGETASRMAESGVLPFFQKIADSMDKHLLPQVEECIENCPACSHLSCVDTISPERVFENVKRFLIPY
ncbi:MAG: hypothetical protein K8S54_02495 [Spirochaetia bacterium]|nr:hypothetical protein [Spirochaetia bacterium]